jgi:predicted DNA-binding transcriptional regulator AlpA
MTTKFLRKRAVSARYGITDRTVERMVEDGRLPQPTYRGRIPLWRESELDESDRVAALTPRPKRDAGAEAATIAAAARVTPTSGK